METYADLLNYFADRPEIAAKIEANTDNWNKANVTGYRLSNIMHSVFSFQMSPEGWDYWDKIHSDLRDKERETQ